jgi:hypothetical protein
LSPENAKEVVMAGEEEKKGAEGAQGISIPTYRAAYEAKRDALIAISGDVLAKKPRVDLDKAATMAEGTAAKLGFYRAELVGTFGEAAGYIIDQMTPAAFAARQADVEYTRAIPSGDMSIYDAEVSASYQILFRDARSLVAHGLLQESDLDRARDLQGYEAKKKSLLVLVSLLREKWSVVQGRTPLTIAQIDAAELAAQRMNTAIAFRDYGVLLSPAADMRLRALVHLILLNDEARRMMTFICWHHGDVDEIVPSFWGERARRRGVISGEAQTPSTQPATGESDLDPTGEGGPFTS